jgi:hypothetical protein
MRFDEQRAVTAFFRDQSYPVEEDRLADTPEANENHAFCGTTGSQPMKSNLCLFQNRVAANQFGRRGTGTRRKRVLQGVHIESLSLYTENSLYADNFSILTVAIPQRRPFRGRKSTIFGWTWGKAHCSQKVLFSSLFDEMMARIEADTVRYLFFLRFEKGDAQEIPEQADEAEENIPLRAPASAGVPDISSSLKQKIRHGAKASPRKEQGDAAQADRAEKARRRKEQRDAEKAALQRANSFLKR